MSAHTIISEARADGVRLSLTPDGGLLIRGTNADMNRWLPVIREHRAEIGAQILDAPDFLGDRLALGPWLERVGDHLPIVVGIRGRWRTQYEPIIRGQIAARRNHENEST
jgi:hypothetical protein